MVDLNDPRLYDDPWDFYRWLRAEHPVWWNEESGLYAISRHQDVIDVSRNPERYSAAKGVRPRVPVPMSLISMDDPEHARQRRIISRGFTPRRVRDLAEHIRELARSIIDDVADRGEIDFVEDFAIHVPLIVIAEMMGLDPDTRMKLYRWSDAMMEGDGHVEPHDPKLLEATEAFIAYTDVCRDLIEERRQDPKDDIISALTQAFDAGDLDLPEDVEAAYDASDLELTNDELLMFLVLLVVAGNETTRNAISGGLRAFSLFPDQQQKLLEHPDLIDSATEEIMRWVSPVISFIRTVTEDHTLHGVDLREGDRVLLLYQSANRDERVFDHPDAFRVDRDPNPHIAFGTGPHYCLGANLARLEVKIVFEELFRRLGDIRAADPDAPIDRGDSALVLAIQHLPAVFTPSEAAVA